MTVTKLIGWELNQWAIAKAWHAFKSGEEAPCSLQGAHIVMRFWWKTRAVAPGEIVLANVPIPKDEEWAHRTFDQVVIATYA